MQGYGNSANPSEYALNSNSLFSDMDDNHIITSLGITINIKNMTINNKIELASIPGKYNINNTTIIRNAIVNNKVQFYPALNVDSGVSSTDLATALNKLKNGQDQTFFTKR